MLVRAAFQDGSPVEGAGERIVRGHVFQFGAHPVGGHEHCANGQQQHSQHIGAEIEGLHRGRFHQVAHFGYGQYRLQPHQQHAQVQRQRGLHHAHREVAVAALPQKHQCAGVRHGDGCSDNGHAHAVRRLGPGKPGQGQHDQREWNHNSTPLNGSLKETAAAHMEQDEAQQDQSVAQPAPHFLEPWTRGREKNRGNQPCGGRQCPIAQPQDAGRVVAPHEAQHQSHDQSHETTHGNQGAWIK